MFLLIYKRLLSFILKYNMIFEKLNANEMTATNASDMLY